MLFCDLQVVASNTPAFNTVIQFVVEQEPFLVEYLDTHVLELELNRSVKGCEGCAASNNQGCHNLMALTRGVRPLSSTCLCRILRSLAYLHIPPAQGPRLGLRSGGCCTCAAAPTAGRCGHWCCAWPQHRLAPHRRLWRRQPPHWPRALRLPLPQAHRRAGQAVPRLRALEAAVRAGPPRPRVRRCAGKPSRSNAWVSCSAILCHIVGGDPHVDTPCLHAVALRLQSAALQPKTSSYVKVVVVACRHLVPPTRHAVRQCRPYVHYRFPGHRDPHTTK